MAGKEPWSRNKVIWLVAVPLMALLILFATWWAVDHIQGTLAADARADLAAASIDTSELEIDFDYRDGEATGVLPAGATIAATEAAVDHGLLRTFTVDAEIAAAPAEHTDTSADDTEPAGGAADEAQGAAEQLQADIDQLQTELDGLAVEIRENVVFESGSTTLSPTATATLDKVAAALRDYPDPVLEVAGHTDNTGDPAANQALSLSRAEAVVAYLIEAGVDADRVRARGAGDTEPIASNDTADGRAENRRVALTALASF